MEFFVSTSADYTKTKTWRQYTNRYVCECPRGRASRKNKGSPQNRQVPTTYLPIALLLVLPCRRLPVDTQRLIQPHLQLASLHLLRPPPAAPQPPPHSQAGAREREYSIGVVLTKIKIGASTRKSRRREGRKRSAGIVEGYFPPRSRRERNNEKTVGNKRSNCSGSAAVVGGGTRKGAAA